MQSFEVVAAIKQLLITELQVEPALLSNLDVATPLLGLGIGLDSIEAMRLAMALERHFNIKIPDTDLTVDLFSSVGALSGYVSRKVANATSGREP